MTNANPSIDPADQDTLTGTINFAFRKLIQQMDHCLPAQVIAYDRVKNRAQVKILISMINTNGQVISRAQVPSVPVIQYGGGDCVLAFNLVAGDIGILLATDRDMSTFLQYYTEQAPNTYRMFNFSSSVFIPTILQGLTLDSGDAENAVLQTLDGSVRISLGADGVIITAPGDGIKLDSNVQVTGTLTVDEQIIGSDGLEITGNGHITGTLTVDEKITGSDGLEITGNSLITGLLHVSGDITASGDITPHVPP